MTDTASASSLPLAGLESARALVASADVVLENFRPGLMAKLGLDYATLSAEHPALIYASHKGFLPSPYEKRLALDEVVQNMAGLTYMTGAKGRPLRAGTSVNDIMGGMFAAIGVLAALQERARTGRGQEIQSALFENCCLLAAQHMMQFQMSGEVPPPFPSRVSRLERVRHLHAGGRRAALHRRGQRQAVRGAVPGARPRRPAD